MTDTPQPETTPHEPELYIIELESQGSGRYIIAERFMAVDPTHGAPAMPWAELERMFREAPLRAIPMPGWRVSGSHRSAPPGVSTNPPGVSTGAPGVSTAGNATVEINLIKVGKDS